MGIKDQMRKKRKKQELLDHREDVIYKESIRILGSYQEELRLKGALKGEEDFDLQPALDLLAQRNREE